MSKKKSNKKQKPQDVAEENIVDAGGDAVASAGVDEESADESEKVVESDIEQTDSEGSDEMGDDHAEGSEDDQSLEDSAEHQEAQPDSACASDDVESASEAEEANEEDIDGAEPASIDTHGSESSESEPSDDASEINGTDENSSEESELPLERVVEAILISAQTPLNLKQITKCAGKRIKPELVKSAIDGLNLSYEAQGHAFEVVCLADTYQIMTRPEYVVPVRRLLGDKVMATAEPQDKRLSPAALDTLSIIAYKQPITRVEIEAVRGVGCGQVLRLLAERGVVRIVGKREDVIGHPLMYGTTEPFLREFGLASIEDLPMINEMRKLTGATLPIPSPEQKPEVQLTVLGGVDDESDGDEASGIDVSEGDAADEDGGTLIEKDESETENAETSNAPDEESVEEDGIDDESEDDEDEYDDEDEN